ncbi:bifunctional cytochrome P450/NADPH--P450 reductase [Pseudonocardia bannensis]|uniref:Bifunctional cytochrome P450/NADPH--P450 reductase n=1 Tax=Pseudonocardia bannensis TaxID=630973 RepID=A0A848DPP3_9PSEU|nr:cytochrome P450 [Pseudonocardia bannensis]NMH94294.1 cytochrome P450 [Pseudonocardia bannensis]
MNAPIGIDDLPGPRGLPLLGNILDIDSAHPMESMMRMAREYGPIFRLSIPGGARLVVSGADLAAEVCDDTRFDKLVGGGLKNLRSGPIGTGLFTADTDDPLWHRAHNILLSPFSLQSMRDYMPMMQDIAGQLMDKWERLNPGEEVDVPADMTRLTLDTIALCGFGYRFNSFYRDTQHPFVAAMIRNLEEAQTRARELPIQTRLRLRAQRQSEEDQAFMAGVVDDLVRERRAQGDAGDTGDLLGRMLTGVDRQSGERLPDENIRAQCVTFLVAGHETTSGLLSFALYYLMKNPGVAERARAEVDEVLGATARPTYEQVHRLAYVAQILDETLRLWPTAPGFNRAPLQDTVIGGRYAIGKGTPVTVLSLMLHRDPSVWGPDAEEFDPDRMALERKAALPPHAYKPFGTGQRACIGRQFALQEAVLVLGMLLQRFEFIDHLDYRLRTKTTLTIKPDDMRIQVRRRPGRPIDRPVAVAPPAARAEQAVPAAGPVPTANRHGTPLHVLFGSNLGTAEGIATRLAREGTERGYAVTLGALDDHVDDLPGDGATVLVCSSYNGTPPDNATAFCGWLRADATGPQACEGVGYTVFGCGNTDWGATYQAVPTLLDTELEAHGGRRIHPRGGGNAQGDFDAQYRAWHTGLWADVAAALDLPASAAEPAATGPRLSVSLVNRQLANPVIVSYRAQPAQIRVNRELLHGNGLDPAGRSTRHLEIALPAGVTYRAGDHLGVLPRNNIDLIGRVMRRFTLDAGQYATIIPNSGRHTHLPIDEPTPILGVLGSCVELQDVAGRDDIETLATYTDDPDTRAALESLTGDDEQSRARYREQVFEPNRSVLDLLEQFPACAVPFEVYLDLLPPLRPRYYSISSSPMISPDVCSITIGVLQAPARSGVGHFRGVCSTHLSLSPDSSTVFVFVREPTIPFRPPDNPHLPMVMVGAGTGLAPFRGFLQERAALRERGVPVASSLLFFGCRTPEADQLYAEELRDFEKQGVVRVETAFSRSAHEPRRYVQDALQDSGDKVWALLQQGAVVLVCGNASTMAPAVRAAFTRIFQHKTGASAADAQAWLSGLRSADRFLEDIWGGG